MEDSGRDHDAFDVGQNARMLEKTRVGERGDDRLLMVVCQLRNIGFSGKKLVKERIDRGEVDPSGPHDEPQLVDGALLPFVDSIEDPFFHFCRRGAGEGGGDNEFSLPVEVAADLTGQAEGLPRTGRGGDEKALHHGWPPGRPIV